MKSKLLYFDLAVCLIWALNAFCGRLHWNQYTTVYLFLVMAMRLSVSFCLYRREKKTWIPLVIFGIGWALLRASHIYNGVGEIGDYFFHVTGLEYNRYTDHLFSGSFWLWIVVAPVVHYLILFFRRKLENTITMKELLGGILWKDRVAKYYCTFSMLSFLSISAGYCMQARICEVMCFITSPIAFWLLCRYLSIKRERVWIVALGAMSFWYAQSLGGVFRVVLLAISFVMIAYACIYLYKSTKSHIVTLLSMIVLGVVLPTFSIGYNQYACINYPRYGFYYLSPYNGILFVNETTNGEMVGLRDRYRLLVKPEYEAIVPNGHTTWGGATNSYQLRKDGYCQTYNVWKNEIMPSDNNPQLQKDLCKVVDSYYRTFDSDYFNRSEIVVKDLVENKIVGEVKSRQGKVYYGVVLPEDTICVTPGQFVRTDSVELPGNHFVNILNYAENYPNDTISRYLISVRLSSKQAIDEADIHDIVENIKSSKIFK